MNRTTLIGKIRTASAKLDRNRAEGISLAWDLAGLVIALRGTFPQGKDSAKAFKATAATAAGRSEGMIENLVRAWDLRESLTKAQRAKVEGWSYDAVLCLSGKDMTTQNRTTLIGKVQKAGTVNVKTVRDLKRTVTGTAKRNRKGTTAQNADLAKAIGERVAGLVADGHTYLALIAGAQLAQDNAGKDVAAALTLIATQARKAAEVVAK